LNFIRSGMPYIVRGGLWATIVSLAFLAACAVPTTPGPQPVAAPSQVVPTTPANTVVKETWERSAHARSFVLAGDGTNNECARCHSPRNWVPVESADLPKTCASCKFTVKEPVPVKESSWRSIGCDVCHDFKGDAKPKVVWLNSVIAGYETGTDPYEPVRDHNELCRKCHRDFKTFSYSRDLGTSVHARHQCTGCHNPHSLKADCSGCHAEAMKKLVPGHDAAHKQVNCVACHDAGGLKPGPVDGQNRWMPFRTVTAGSQKQTVPYQSHNLQRKVDCSRCHYAGNPWNLKSTV
jgi:hypothetical protein